MKYYTSEFYELNGSLHHMPLRKVKDKEYTDRDIEALKKRQLNAAIKKARAAYDTPPVKIDILEYGFEPKDFEYVDPQTYETKIPANIDEVPDRFEQKHRKECKEFESTLPSPRSERLRDLKNNAL